MWKIRNRLNKKKTEFPIFRFLFSDLWSFWWRHHPNFRWIFTITEKIKIAKCFYFVFHFIQHTAHYPQKLDQNWGRGGGGGRQTTKPKMFCRLFFRRVQHALEHSSSFETSLSRHIRGERQIEFYKSLNRKIPTVFFSVLDWIFNIFFKYFSPWNFKWKFSSTRKKTFFLARVSEYSTYIKSITFFDPFWV